jgi:hypothetical protein
VIHLVIARGDGFMSTQSLFGNIATRFTIQPENLATESLFYIIKSSKTAERAFLSYVARAGVNIGDGLFFQTQVHDTDKSIPDMVAMDVQNESVLIVEAKFWAGLTDHQPLTYLTRLPKEKMGVLLFIAPKRRFQTLWAELLDRCKRKNVDFQEELVDDNILLAKINHHVMVLTSWQAVLSVIAQAANAAQEMQLASDVSQLDGLCSKMDSSAFLPIHSDELSANIGARVQQYYEFVDELVESLKKERLVTTGQGKKQLRPTGGNWGYGRYFELCGYASYLSVNLGFWAARRETPLWLQIKGKNWRYSPELKEKLHYLEHDTPSKLFRDDEWLTIPLCVPIGVEKNAVLGNLLIQIRDIAARISN